MYIVLILIAVFLGGTFIGCTAQPKSADEGSAQGGNIAESKTENSVSGEHGLTEYDSEVLTVGDFIVPFNTVDQLDKYATLAVEGTVKSKSVHLHEVNGEAVPYTLFDIEVAKSIKGNVESGYVITVAEYGGIVTAAQAGLDKKFPDMKESEKEKKIFISFGNKPVEVDQRLLLFLSNEPGYQILTINTPYYMLVGEYHGKFVHDSDNSYVQSLPISDEKDENPIIIDDSLNVFS